MSSSSSSPQTDSASFQRQASIFPFSSSLNPLVLRLNRSNYQYWRSQILSSVRAHGLDDFLLGLRTAPQQYLTQGGVNGGPQVQVANPDFANWIRYDQFLVSWLVSSISESMLGHVNRCRTSAEIWLTLERMFATQSKARILQLRLKLQTLKKESLSVDEYILKMREVADMLISAGQMVSDDELIIYILGGLGSEYESVIVNLTSRSDSVSLEEVQFMLQNQEMRLDHLSSSIGSADLQSPNVNLAFNSNYKKHNQGFNRSGARGGRGSLRGSGRGNGRVYTNHSAGNKPICQVCGKSGHTALRCYHRFDLSFQHSSEVVNTVGDQSKSANQVSFASPESVNDPAWYVDSGATDHVTNDLENLSVRADYKGKGKLTVGNGSQLPILHVGANSLISSNRCSKPITLTKILHVPQVTKNLLSISRVTKDNPVTVEFNSNSCLVKDNQTKQVLLRGDVEDGLYKLRVNAHPVKTDSCSSDSSISRSVKSESCDFVSNVSLCKNSSCNNVSSCIDNNTLWHMRLGHPSSRVLNNVLHSIDQSSKKSSLNFCDACQYGKLHQISFPLSTVKSTCPFDIVHGDVWCSAPCLSTAGFRYYVIFVDDCSKFSWIFPLKTKSEVHTVFLEFNALIEKQFNTKFKYVQTD